MDLLPKSCIEFPVFFDEEELAQLEGSPFKELLEDIQVGIDLIYDDICRLVPEFKQFDLMEYCEVLTIIQSRAFVLKINGVKSLCLVPFADMFNHRYPI